MTGFYMKCNTGLKWIKWVKPSRRDPGKREILRFKCDGSVKIYIVSFKLLGKTLWQLAETLKNVVEYQMQPCHRVLVHGINSLPHFHYWNNNRLCKLEHTEQWLSINKWISTIVSCVSDCDTWCTCCNAGR